MMHTKFRLLLLLLVHAMIPLLVMAEPFTGNSIQELSDTLLRELVLFFDNYSKKSPLNAPSVAATDGYWRRANDITGYNYQGGGGGSSSNALNYGYPNPAAAYGYQSNPTAAYGYQSNPAAAYGYQSNPTAAYGYQSNPAAVYGYQTAQRSNYDQPRTHPNPVDKLGQYLTTITDRLLSGMLGFGPTYRLPPIIEQSNDYTPQSQVDSIPTASYLNNLNEYTPEQRSLLQSTASARLLDPPSSDLQRQLKNLQLLAQMQAKYSNDRRYSPPINQNESPPQQQSSMSDFYPTNTRTMIPLTSNDHFMGTGQSAKSYLDVGGDRLDRFVVHESNDVDALGNPVVGKWKKQGLQWTDGNLRLVNVNGNNLLGSELAVHDKSVDIPVKSWLDIVNGLFPMPPTKRQDAAVVPFLVR